MKGERSLRLLGACLGLLLAGLAPAQAQNWGEIGNSLLKGLGGTGGEGATGAVAGLSQDEVVAGLKEALAKGSEIVVDELGRPDGFLGRPEVRIPLPENTPLFAIDEYALLVRYLPRA